MPPQAAAELPNPETTALPQGNSPVASSGPSTTVRWPSAAAAPLGISLPALRRAADLTFVGVRAPRDKLVPIAISNDTTVQSQSGRSRWAAAWNILHRISDIVRALGPRPAAADGASRGSVGIGTPAKVPRRLLPAYSPARHFRLFDAVHGWGVADGCGRLAAGWPPARG